MIILENGAPELSQYETRRYAITTTMCTHMTFWRSGGAGATMPVIETDNGYKARIPDNLIANYGYIEASATISDGNGSADVIDTGRFYVRESAIPEHYAPDDYESPVYQGLYALIRSMQSRMDAGEFIGDTGPVGPQGDPAPADLVVPAVNAYIAEYLRLHPEATIDEDIIRSAVNAWLANHPEYVTTVMDGAISAAKLAPAVRENVEAVPGLKQDLTALEGEPTTAPINQIFVGATRSETTQGVTWNATEDGAISFFCTSASSATSLRWIKLSSESTVRSSASGDIGNLKANYPTFWNTRNIDIPSGTKVAWSFCSDNVKAACIGVLYDVDGNVLASGKEVVTTLTAEAYLFMVYMGTFSGAYDFTIRPMVIIGDSIPTLYDWEHQGESLSFKNPLFLTTPIDGSVGMEKLDDEVKGIISGIGTKMPYQEGNIFFDVAVDKPLSFNGEVSTSTETVHCVLKLPESYTPSGKPTRLVLACHGASGFLKPSQNTWYNDKWMELIQYLNDSGYACFDSNVISGENADTSGYALGSPLYINVLKKAYDYIVENYNVYPHIFAHGTSMGGVGASAFSHAYPQIVLAESSFAGRNFCQYMYGFVTNGYQPKQYVSLVHGYESDEALTNDCFSHVDGFHEIFSLVKYVDGVPVFPPSRAENYHAWFDYFAEPFNYTRDSLPTAKWIGKRTVPYMAWDSWSDSENATMCRQILKDAFAVGNAVPYVTNIVAGANHTELSYGQVANMRAQLVNWYRRWE